MTNKNNPYQSQIDDLEKQIKENQSLIEDPELGLLAKEEIDRLTKEKQMLEQASQQFGKTTEESKDSGDVSTAKAIIEIRGGAGGDEAKIWGEDLLRMYLRYAENKGLKAEYLDEMVIKISGRIKLEIPKPTIKDDSKKTDQSQLDKDNSDETITKIIYPYELFKYESGVHRVQRVPSTESQGRIHTSTASIAVLPEIKKSPVEIKSEDLEWQFMRAGGAGGQSVNKTSSAVRLTHIPSGVVVKSSRERKQVQNRQIAMDLLYSQLWEIEEEKRLKELGDARSNIGRNMRAEKIRTYNYPQNRITDHRITKSWYSLSNILEGDLDGVIGTVISELSAS